MEKEEYEIERKCLKCGTILELKEFQGQSDNREIDGLLVCPKCKNVYEEVKE